jgi:flavodoxin
MKRILSFLLAVCLLMALTACGNQTTSSGETSPSEPETSQIQTPSSTPETTPEPDPSSSEPEQTEEGERTLVVYFSATGNTKAVAEKIAELTGADIYEIVPAEPYTADDLDYNVSDCRANREMNDASARPAIGGDSIDVSGYDTVMIGYPIWWGTMPRIINTFLDTYDLSGKVILPFCTSGGSGVSQSVSDIRSVEPDADVRAGLRARNAQDSGIESWLNENGISG